MNIVKLHDNRITLINGDCLEVMPKIKPNTVDMVFADLPYGTTSRTWDKLIPVQPFWVNLNILCKNTSPMVFTCSQPFTTLPNASNIENYKYEWIWLKNAPANIFNAQITPMKYHENISVFYREQCLYNPIKEPRNPKNIRLNPSYSNNTSGIYADTHNGGFFDSRAANTIYPRSILPFARVKNAMHPTQKPVELLEYLIKTYTNANAVVLDPTAGSGTTAVACINTNRRCIAIEKDTEFGYFDTMITRCNAAIAKLNNVVQ